MLTMTTNLSSLLVQRGLKESTGLLNQAIERMTTGLKINQVKDNVANFIIGNNMTTQISSLDVAEDNAGLGLDMLTIASDTLDLINMNITRLRDLAIQAENRTYSEESLKAINHECEGLVKEIKRLYKEAEFNGMKLYGAEFEETIPATGTVALATSTYATLDTTLQQLGIDESSFEIYNHNQELIESYETEKNDTIGDIFNVLETYGFNCSITNGVISISSTNGKYVAGDLFQKFGMNLISTNFVSSTSQTSESALVYTAIRAAYKDTTLGEINILTTGTDVIQINDKYGEFVGEFEVDSTTTLGTILKKLANYGIQGSIEDGILSFNSTNGNYLVSEGIVEDLGITYSTVTAGVTYGEAQTSAGVINYQTIIQTGGDVILVPTEFYTTFYTDATATTDSTLEMLNISNGAWTIFDSTTGTVIASGSATADTTMGELITSWNTSDLGATLEDGIIKISSINRYLGGGFVDETGITNTDITVGNSNTSASEITYTSQVQTVVVTTTNVTTTVGSTVTSTGAITHLSNYRLNNSFTTGIIPDDFIEATPILVTCAPGGTTSYGITIGITATSSPNQTLTENTSIYVFYSGSGASLKLHSSYTGEELKSDSLFSYIANSGYEPRYGETLGDNLEMLAEFGIELVDGKLVYTPVDGTYLKLWGNNLDFDDGYYTKSDTIYIVKDADSMNDVKLIDIGIDSDFEITWNEYNMMTESYDSYTVTVNVNEYTRVHQVFYSVPAAFNDSKIWEDGGCTTLWGLETRGDSGTYITSMPQELLSLFGYNSISDLRKTISLYVPTGSLSTLTSTSTKLGQIYYFSGSGEPKFSVYSGGTEHYFTYNRDTTVQSYMDWLTGLGFTVSLNNGKLTVKGKDNVYAKNAYAIGYYIFNYKFNATTYTTKTTPVYNSTTTTTTATLTADSDTSLSTLGLTATKSITAISGNTETVISITTADTLGSVLDKFTSAGFTVTLADGKVTVTGKDAVYITSIDSVLSNLLKISGTYSHQQTVNSNSEDLSYQTISSITTYLVDVPHTTPIVYTTAYVDASEGALIGRYGLNERGYITVMKDNTQSVISVRTNDRFSDLLRELNNAGIEASLADGKITVNPNQNGSFIVGMSDNMLDLLNFNTNFYRTTIGTLSTDSTQYSYWATQTITDDSKMSQIGVTAGNIVVKQNGVTVSTITISDTQDIESFMADLQNAGFKAYCMDGSIYLRAEGDMYIDSATTGSSNAITTLKLTDIRQEIDSTYSNTNSDQLESLSEIINKFWQAATEIELQIGINSDENSRITVQTGITLDNIDRFANIGKKTIAQHDYITELDELLSVVGAKQIELGAYMNRLESAIEEITIKYEGLLSSRSTIMDADLAEVSSTYVTQQIIQQASATLLATVNQTPQLALQLL